MKKISVAKAGSYVSPTKTIDFPAGEYEVTNEQAELAGKAGLVAAEPELTRKDRAPRAQEAGEE